MNKKTRIKFRGIPNGHEFTSLLLAILNSDGKGKNIPDGSLQKRIAALKGPIRLTTYVSLTCTNCPDVVQALNLMAILNDNIEHEMVDGAINQAEVEALHIQGVPSVYADGKLIHVGRGEFGELLEKLEATYGSENTGQEIPEKKYDVLIVGGGPAGSSAAIYSARKGLKVAIIAERIGGQVFGELLEKLEATYGSENTGQEIPEKKYDVLIVGGGPAGSSAAIYSARKGLKVAIIAERIGGQVKETVGIENLISIPYTTGSQLADNLRTHLQHYPIDLFEHRKVEKMEHTGKEKILSVTGGEKFVAPAIIIATGASWRRLNVPGETDYIGKGVAFCPHCDGPFYKGKHVAVIGGGNSGIEAAIDLAGICSKVTVFEFLEELKADQVLQEKAKSLPNVEILVNSQTTEVVGDKEKVTGIRTKDRTTGNERLFPLDGIFVQIGLAANSSAFKEIVATNRLGEIIIDAHCRTDIPGIYAAGDVSTVPYKQIIISMGEGAKAALSAFEDRIKGVLD